MKEYLERLSRYFDEEDVDGFNEMKEDLLEQLAICMEEGQTEEEVVANLPDPKQVAEDYYEDKNIEISSHSKTYVIPKENLTEEFISSVKKKSNRMMKLFLKVIQIVSFILTLGLFFYGLIYIGSEWLVENHFAVIPFLISLLCVAVFLLLFSIRFQQNKKKLRRISGVLLGLTILLTGIFSLTDLLFYQGQPYGNELEVGTYDNISLKVDTDVDVEVTATEVPSSHPFSYVVRGNFGKKDIEKINHSHQEGHVDLTVNKKSWKNVFTKSRNLDVVFLVPKGMVISDVELHLKKGDVRLTDVSSESLNLEITEGDVYFKNTVFDKGQITNDNADLIVEKSKANFNIQNNSGKIVVTDFVGDLSIKDKSGVSILKDIDADSVTLSNTTGRTILEDSKISELSIQSEEGQIAVKNSQGNLDIKNTTGKIVGEDNNGVVKIVNGSGPTIVIQSAVIEGSVTSRTGMIKWLQDEKYPVNIQATSKNGTEDNPYEEVKSNHKVSIQSDTGWVKVLKKVE